jgi:sulfur carrier protein ThiS
MTVYIRPKGMLKDYIGGRDEAEVAPGQTVRAALLALGIPPEIVALVLINDVYETDKDIVLQDGDVVRLMAVIGGG